MQLFTVSYTGHETYQPYILIGPHKRDEDFQKLWEQCLSEAARMIANGTAYMYGRVVDSTVGTSMLFDVALQVIGKYGYGLAEISEFNYPEIIARFEESDRGSLNMDTDAEDALIEYNEKAYAKHRKRMAEMMAEKSGIEEVMEDLFDD